MGDIKFVFLVLVFICGLSFAILSVEEINLIPDLDISRFLPYNITANITNTTELSSVTVNISGINGEGVACWDYYVNGTCGSEELSFPMADQGEGIWLKDHIFPDYIYPEIYFAESDITWYNEPDDIRMWRGNYHLFNFTNSFDMENNMSFWIEFNSIAAAGNSVDLSVYIIGNGSDQIGLDYFTEDWRLKDNTELVATLDRNIAFHHTHTVNSTHHLVALGTNADGTIGSKNINVSEYFWVILYPDSPNTGRGWDLRYHDEILCSNTNAWYTASRTGGTWNSPAFQNGCPDAHIHIARRISNDGINVTVHGIDNETNEDVSSAQFYFGPLPNMPPNPTTITYPLENVTYDGTEHGVEDIINITWNPATDPNVGDNLTYTISLFYANETFVDYLVNDTGELYYEWNISEVDDGDYLLNIKVCDDEPLCVNSTMAGNFTIDLTDPFCGGNGTELNPYLICTPDHLDNVRDDLTAYYKLNNSIDMNVVPYNESDGWLPIGNSTTKFTGTFDGDSKIISNLFINRSSTDYIGMFGYLDSSSVVRNIILANVNVTGYMYVGTLAGQGDGEISNSHVSGNVNGHTRTGGFIGQVKGLVYNSSSSVTVVGISNNIGGFLGATSGSTIISKSYSSGSVTGADFVGGFAGQTNSWTSNVNKILDSYTTGNVIGGGSSVGGFIGKAHNALSEINNSYSTGAVTGAPGGGFAGANEGIINNSFYDNQTSGKSDTGKGEGKTTSEMKDIATFSGWDISLSDSNLNNGYPFLGWQDSNETYVWLIYDEPPLDCVNLSDESTFGTLVVNLSGNYYINDNVTLCQDNYTINVGSSPASALRINCTNCYLDCNNAIIDGVDNSGYGIYNNDENNDGIGIYNCHITNYNLGIYFTSISGSVDSNTLINNTAYGNSGNGFYFYNSINNTFNNNSAYDNERGFLLWGVGSSTFNNTIASNNTANGGIHLWSDSSSNNFTNTIACGNTDYDLKDANGANTFTSSTYDTSTPDNYVYFDKEFWCNGTPFVPTPINITLTYPEDLAVLDTNETTLNYTVNIESFCGVYTNITGVWNRTCDQDNVEGNLSCAVGPLANGNYIWNVYCEESINSSNNAWAEPVNRTFTINYTAYSIPPINVTLTYPEDLAVLDTNETTLNYTVNIESFCGVYTNITGVWNRTCDQDNVEGNLSCAVGPLANGNYIWNVYCEDVVNSSNNEWGEGTNRTFTINYTALSLECVEPTNGMLVNESVVFCSGTYNLANGIVVNANDISITCNNTIFNGTGLNEGIELNGKTNVNIIGCTVQNYYYGLHLHSSSNNNTFTNNTIRNNFHFGVYFLSNSNFNTFTNNIVNENGVDKNGVGIYLGTCSNNIFTNNTIFNNLGYGVFLFTSNNNTYIDNTITTNNNGIYFSHVSNYNNITNNNFNNNSVTGIDLSESLYNTFVNNTANNNVVGIQILSTPNNTLIDNTANNNLFGIRLWNSPNNTLTNNIACGNTDYDLYDNNISIWTNSIYNTSDPDNSTYFDQFATCAEPCVENITNTTWSEWSNEECINTTHMNQSRFLTEYDANDCGTFENVTHTEYQTVEDETCSEPCVENITNTTWSSWSDEECINTTHMNQSRFLTEYDSNVCGTFENVTHTEYQTVEDETCVEPTVACGDLINESVVFNTNLLCFGEEGISVNSNDITIDCNGNTLTGDGTGIGINIEGFSNVEIINCEIENFYFGIYVDDANNTLVSDSYIHNNLCEGLYVYSPENSLPIYVENTIFENNTGECVDTGIFVSYSTLNLLNSQFISNGLFGINDEGDQALTTWTIDDYALCRNNAISFRGEIVFAGGVLELDNCTLLIENPETNRTSEWDIGGDITDIFFGVEVEENETETFEFPNSDVEIDLTANETYDFSISVRLLNSTEVNGTNPNAPNGEVPFKGITIEVKDTDYLSWAIIRLYYNLTELNELNIDEDSLRMYYFNETSEEWELVAQQGIVKTNPKHVWGNVTHFSTYAIFGEVESEDPPSGGTRYIGGGGAPVVQTQTIIEESEEEEPIIQPEIPEEQEPTLPVAPEVPEPTIPVITPTIPQETIEEEEIKEDILFSILTLIIIILIAFFIFIAYRKRKIKKQPLKGKRVF